MWPEMLLGFLVAPTSPSFLPTTAPGLWQRQSEVHGGTIVPRRCSQVTARVKFRVAVQFSSICMDSLWPQFLSSCLLCVVNVGRH